MKFNLTFFYSRAVYVDFFHTQNSKRSEKLFFMKGPGEKLSIKL